MRGSTRVKFGAAIAALALAATAACSTDSDDPEPDSSAAPGAGKKGGSITVQLGEPQHGLVPTNTSESEGNEVLNALFAGLVDYDIDTNKPENRVAESITSADNKVWTIKIKPDYTFHNGEKVTASSFVDSWNYGANQKNAQEAIPFFDKIEGSDELAPGEGKEPTAETLKGLKVIDETTFEVTLKVPFAQFPSMLGYNAYYPVPKAFFADPKAFDDAPIGNGPFMMDGKWEHNQQIKVKRYEGFPDHDGKALLDAVTFKIYEKLDTAYNDLRAGAIDITDKLPVSAMGTVQKDFPGRTSSVAESSIGYIGFPLATNPIYANPDLRKAISMAIDRKTLNDKIFSGTRPPADDFVSPIIPGYRQGICGEACTYNPQAAKDLYAKAGGLPGNKLEIGYNTDGGHKDWIEAVGNMLKDNLGIDVTPRPFEKFGAILDALDQKQFSGAFRMGWTMDYPSIENYLRPIFSKIAIQNGSNHAGYVNEDFEAALAAADVKQGDEGIAAYQAASDILLKDLPYIPVFFYMSSNAWSDRVTNVRIDAQNRMRLDLVSLT
ncbi:ABC transporter substrate-binding protein [Yinghuangia sp. ASG 101]|uniref:peptide ABC transporter substrate-binding protein n=1 Tax=Yinghuangia sp. ASG 101 TaxID=2896848 RepID=UPI001E5808AA|nr:ABC transporter substrate-binding protein [Yinghuangia sp. ASG 101]UGQ09449.1 ABC transporter substrate-binding protein [Yinghuangia sp. ASG 101]